MAMFDPKKAPKSSALPASEAIVILQSFTRKVSKTRKEYLNARWVVIHGPMKKRSFFDNVHLDQSSEGSMRRLSMLCEAMGVTEAFDLDDDAAIRANMVNRPIKVAISQTTSGEYTNNGVSRILKPSDAEIEIMQAWAIEAAENAEWSGASSGGGDSFGGGGGDFGDRGDAPPPADDDIPFLTSSPMRDVNPVSRILR